MRTLRQLLLVLIAAAIVWGQSTPSGCAILPVTGTWVSYAGDGTTLTLIATLTQSGSTWSGSYHLTAITGHPDLVGTFSAGTISGSTYNATLVVTEPQPDGSTLIDTGTVTFALSTDGSSLSGSQTTTDNETPPVVRSGPFGILRSMGAALSPATVSLSGSSGGKPVVDTSSLTIANCGVNSVNYTVSVDAAGAAWLGLGPSATSPYNGSLPKGQSVNLQLTADPGKLAESTTPYPALITLAEAGGGTDFVSTKSAVQFLVGAGSDTLTFSGIYPGALANLESSTSVAFTVQVGGKLNSADSGTLALQLLDNSGTPIATGPEVSISHGDISQKLSITRSIPDGNVTASLVVVLTPKNLPPSQSSVATYSVYPDAEIIVGVGGNMWRPPATAPGPVGVIVGFKGGSPDRGTVINLIARNSDGSSAGTITPIDVSAGDGFYPEIFTPSLSVSSNAISVEADFAQASPTYLLDVHGLGVILVDKPPAIAAFRLAGPDDNFVDATKPSILGVPPAGVARTPGIVASVSYTGMDANGYAVLYGNGVQLAYGPAPAGDSAVQVSDGNAATGNSPTYVIQLQNVFGQTISSATSAPEILESVKINSATLDANNNLHVNVTYVWPGIKELTIKATQSLPRYPYNTFAAPFTCVAATSVTAPQSIDCPAIPVSLESDALSVFVTAADSGPQGNGESDTASISVPHQVTPAAGTTVAAGPVNLTPSAGGPPVTAKQVSKSIGGDFLAAVGLGGAARPAHAASPANSGTAAALSSLVFLPNTMSFSPAVPNNQTQMVYFYSPGDLPDDPGFDPAHLEIVSYDTSSGQLLTYPSIVDTNAMTVTATLPGIPPYLALAVPASTLGPQLNLPFDPQSAPAPAGLALFNAGADPAETTFTARGGDGTPLAPQSAIGAFAPAQQTAVTFDSLGAATAANPGWVQASASAPGTIGVAVLANLTSLETLPLLPGSNSEVIPGIELAAGNLTQISVANATSFQNLVSLELHDTTGALVDTARLNLAPKQAVTSPLSALFVKAQAPFKGYVMANATERLSAAAVASVGNAISAIAGQLPESGTSLYSAHFETGPGQATRLDVVNTGSGPAHVTIQFNKDDGSSLAQSITTTIAAGAQYWIDLTATLGLSTKVFSTGWIGITSDQPGLVGDVTISDTLPIPSYRTSIPLAPAQNSQAIPYVVNTTALPMTLYAANTGLASAHVTLTFYAVDGTVAGTATPVIPAGGRLEGLLSTLVPASIGQSGGALEIGSDQPLSATAMIFPSNAAADWAAIPAQPSSLVKGSGPAPQISTGGVTNAAVAKTILVRSELATVYGSNFTTAPAFYQAESLPLPYELGGVYVTVGGILAPLYYVNSTQINFQVPSAVASGSTVKVVITVNGVSSAPASIQVADYAVGVFSYFRTATAYDPIIVHFADNSIITPSNPAVPGEIIVIYGTGIGKLTTFPADSFGAPASPLAQAVDNPTVTIGSVPSGKIYFAGLTPGSIGLAQFDVTLPASLRSGNLPLVINFPGDSSPPVNLAVQGNITGP